MGYNKSNNTISGLFKSINDNFTCMSITLPEDKKKILDKEIKAVDAKLEVVTRFKDTVAVVEDFCTALVNFDNSLKAVDGWKDTATAELKDIKEASGAMLPEGGNVDKDAQAFKNELNRITDYVTKLAADTKIECDKYSNEVKALNEKVSTFDKTCLTYAKVLEAANGAAQKMTTHGEADAEVAALKERYNKVKATSDEWVKKVDVLLKEWTLLDNTVTELNSWVAKDKSSEGENQFSLEKMESTLGELKNIFKEKEKLVEGL